ncbi:WD40 repeat domain-containing protein [Calothrix sp. UHCC 0171]|uniref:WD40 repeat domain-containing protein n=1 Tax=Calothrix sp. UHCC 0171 TaxID=3110245 RepID=UPI002B1F725E|nr:WD40 repeat domain-containing protein [Calothrix sp. UHCC 0171]MEA5569912.1 WD40 repeat domain-containing protein [Calothrix sp. UHCC 0171]
MEQGIRVLIQLVLEFAPVVVNLVQRRNEASGMLAKYQPPKEIKEFLEVVDNSLTSSNLEKSSFFELEREKILQQQLAIYSRQTQLEIAQQEREATLKLPEVNRILDSWPLRLYPSQILESQVDIARTPLKIFVAPPKILFDKFDSCEEDIADIELMLAEGLRNFLNCYYSLHNQTRPTEFLAGAWYSKRFHSESSIKALFGMLKSEPILILESETDGEYINFRIGYWGLGQDNYYYKTISRIPYKQIIYQSAKNRALQWKKVRDELILLGEDLEEINAIGGDNAINLEMWEREKKWQQKGIDTSQISLKYRVNRQDFEQLSQVLVNCHCLVTSWIADVYHLVHHDVSPLLPDLLPRFVEDGVDFDSISAIASGYKQVYQALASERSYWIPELALQLAQSLSSLSDSAKTQISVQTLAQEQVDYSVNAWLQMRNLVQFPAHSANNQVNHPLQIMQSAVRIEDEEYIEKLKAYFASIDDFQNLTLAEELLNNIAELKTLRSSEYAYLTNTLTGHSEKVTSVVISPDGKSIISGGADKTVKVWNIHTGKILRTITGHTGEISSVAVSPDGNFLAVGISDTPRSNIKVWELNTGKLVHTLLGHNKPVNVVSISPDGQILASGSNKIKIWNLTKGDRVCTLWHSSAVNATAITPDGSILVSGTSDNKIKLWNPQTGEPLRTFMGHSGGVKALALHPNGQILISGSTDNTIKAWDLSAGKMLHNFIGHAGEVKTVAISHDGQMLLSGSSDKTIKIWHLASGELLQTLTGHLGAVNSVTISPDNCIVASASSDKTIKIWQLARN